MPDPQLVPATGLCCFMEAESPSRPMEEGLQPGTYGTTEWNNTDIMSLIVNKSSEMTHEQ